MKARKPTFLLLAAALVVAGIIALIFQIRAQARQPSPVTVVLERKPSPDPEAPTRAAPRSEPPAPAPEPRMSAPPSEAGLWREEGPKPVRPKDPSGPERDWRDFNDEEKAAQASLEHDTADLGEVIARLEQGTAIERVRGEPVTAEEQEQLQGLIADITEVYEAAYDSAYSRETSLIDFAETMRGARARFDTKLREVYGLTNEQFYDLFPYRREFLPP